MAMSPEERKARARERYHANREEILAKRRAWNAKHVEERRAQRNQWAKNNPDKIKAQKKRLRERHGPEIDAKLREYMSQKPEGSDLTRGQIHKRKYREKHREELLLKQKEYQRNNREKINAYWRMRYKQNPEPIKYRNQKYIDTHREEVKARGRKNYYAKRDYYLAYSLEWKRRNPEKARASVARSYWKHRGKRIASSIDHHRRNRERINQKAKEWRERSSKLQEWRERNRDKILINRKKRWQKYKETFKDFQNAYGTRSPRRVAIYRKWDACGELCYICGFHVELDEIHVDHIHPVAKGGTNDIGNLMPAHRLCNIRKKDRLDYPIVRRDLIAATAHIQAIPRNLAAQVRSEWESRKLRARTKP